MSDITNSPKFIAFSIPGAALSPTAIDEDFTDSDYALGEFIDRYGPRLAHFNGVMQLLSQLAMPEDENQN